MKKSKLEAELRTMNKFSNFMKFLMVFVLIYIVFVFNVRQEQEKKFLPGEDLIK